MSYKYEAFFKDILINEYIYFASKNKKLIRIQHENLPYIAMWTDENVAESYLLHHSIDYDKIIMDEIFDPGDKVLVNVNNGEEGNIVDIVKMTDELMSELDDIRMREFIKDVAKYDEVYGLTNKGEKNFIMISDDDHNKPHIMPVWSIKSRARKVRDQDFEECDLIEIEGEAVAIDLKSGVVGTVVSAQKLSNEATF